MTENSISETRYIPGSGADIDGLSPANVDRICSPAETLDRVASALREYGVTRLARITGLDRIGIPVWNAMRPNARSIAVHQGKGLTDVDAKASACMEALERAVAEAPPVESVKYVRDELSAKEIAFDAIEEFLAIGESLPRSVAIDWVRGFDLVRRSDVLVPLEALTIDRTKTYRYWQSSDGLASGNTFDEAVLHGLLERIERDADVLFRFAKRPARERACFDPGKVGSRVVDKLVAMTSAAGFRVVTLDMTSDIGIPTVLAYLFPSGGNVSGLRYTDVTMGSGAHFSTAKATVRALTEAVQSRLTLISGARDDVDPDLFLAPLHPTIASDLQLSPFSRPPSDVEGVGNTIPDRISALVAMLTKRRINRILAIDLAPGETRFAVAKLLIPELESPDGNRTHRFGPRAFSKLTVF